VTVNLEPSQEAPVYTAVPEGSGAATDLWMICWNEGWRSGILCSGMYKDEAAWLLEILGRKPRAGLH
jgi:hypothetical protein